MGIKLQNQYQKLTDDVRRFHQQQLLCSSESFIWMHFLFEVTMKQSGNKEYDIANVPSPNELGSRTPRPKMSKLRVAQDREYEP